ncbi:MAG: 4'-phosphopantetheinyl transferase superfamily protein [Gammaproteobacteria bacterium]|nr:4'-phosphopantetheinyl transferase superfamily protein [Gammaproteobacteria bacterium]
MPTSFHHCRWTHANTAEFSSPDEIHVWKISLFDPRPDELEILSRNELQRSHDFKNETARKTYVCSRLIMRWLFASYLKQPASELKFQTTQHGKPFLVGNTTELKFNLSHSGAVMLLAVSPIIELGIDIEQHKEIKNWEKIAQKVFDTQLVRSLKQQKQPEKAFISAWTEFEARQKSHGEGIFGKKISPIHNTVSINMNIDGFEASLCYIPATGTPDICCFNFTE